MTEAPEFSAVDTAYTHLRVAILSGGVRPGERILEADVAAKTKTSRTPVREALRRLGAEGLVEVIANKGARVASLSALDLTEIFDLRMLVEPYTAACAAQGASLAQLDGMKAVSSQMRCEVRDQSERWSGRLTMLNREFHTLIFEAAGNSRLMALARNLMDPNLVNATFKRYTAAELERSMLHHDEIVLAIETRNEQWARGVMVSHLAAAFEVTKRERGLSRSARPSI